MTFSLVSQIKLPTWPGPKANEMRIMCKNTRFLLKWIGISIFIGIAGGGGAIVFYLAIRLTTGLFLGTIVGYMPPGAAGEGTIRISSFWGTVRPWLLPLVTSLGGLISGIIVYWLAPEAEKGGQDLLSKPFMRTNHLGFESFW